ncbi:MAG: DUF808 domain-containing protein [Lysobacteraceae bacterium]
MAFSSLFALIDDIATVLDDVAVLTKVAAKKTAGVLGDDLALNAQQVSGVHTERELPVVWAVAKGSLLNKAILVPAALLISAFLPTWVIGALMMIGGAFLCFEGVEKVLHALLPSHKAEGAKHHERLVVALNDESVDLLAFEKDKIKGAIRTDFILSAEIIVISLGTVAQQPFGIQVGTLVAIALLMTVGVYGLVAGIVKLDDLGLKLVREGGFAARAIGRGILAAAPWLMKSLSVAGVVAMFLVGGGLFVHNIPPLHHFVEHLAHGHALGWLVEMSASAVIGAIAGLVVVMVVALVKKLKGGSTPEAASH